RVVPDHPEVAAGFIQEHEAPRVDPDGAGTPDRPRSLVPLAGTQGLFLRVQPSRAISRLIVGPETRTVESCSYQAQCSARVASGAASRRAGSMPRSAAVLVGGGPRRG